MNEYEVIVDDATTVRAPRTSTADKSAVIYNMQGQQLDVPQRGVNIIEGERRLVK